MVLKLLVFFVKRVWAPGASEEPSGIIGAERSGSRICWRRDAEFCKKSTCFFSKDEKDCVGTTRSAVGLIRPWCLCLWPSVRKDRR